MDLADLLKPERIRCRCSVQSKKRTLQTVAEILGESLRASQVYEVDSQGQAPNDEFEAPAGINPLSIAKKKARKHTGNSVSETESLSDMSILDAFISRERLGSTGLGHGVGLPHSRLSYIKEPVAAFLTLNEGVDYESTDGQKVDLVLGLLVPEDCNDDHLKILAKLAKRFSNDTLRSQLRNFEEPERLYQHLLDLPLPSV